MVRFLGSRMKFFQAFHGGCFLYDDEKAIFIISTPLCFFFSRKVGGGVSKKGLGFRVYLKRRVPLFLFSLLDALSSSF